MKSYCLFLLLFVVGITTVFCHTKVRLRDVQTLTLNRGEYTTGRRNSPVPQLRSVGGTAQGQYTPAVVQCYNRGFDGQDVQWECKADMPREYTFGKIAVSCEGFDYPDDPYILAGSCGLEYELNVSPLGSAQYAKKNPSASYDDSNGINWTGIVYFIVVCFIIYILYVTLSGPREGHEGDRNRGQGWFPGGGGGGGGNDPQPPGWRPPPPSYDQATKGGSTTAGAAPGGGGPGFWTGLGAGALGGYLFGNRGNGGGYRRRNNYYQSQFDRDTGFHDQPSTSSFGFGGGSSSSGGGASSSRHTSTSFGGTTRR